MRKQFILMDCISLEKYVVLHSFHFLLVVVSLFSVSVLFLQFLKVLFRNWRLQSLKKIGFFLIICEL